MNERVTLRTVGGNRVEASNGASSIVLDLPKYDGGDGNGLGPHETLLAALGSCTAMTLSVYAKRKQWPLEGVELSIERTPAPVGAGDVPVKIAVDVKVLGPLDDAQKQKLLEIAQKCPVYKTLKGEIDITERLAS
jgi:putative redox protein